MYKKLYILLHKTYISVNKKVENQKIRFMETQTRISKQMYKPKIFLSLELQNFILIILRPEDKSELMEMDEERVFAIEEGESTDSDNSGGRRPLIQEPEYS